MAARKKKTRARETTLPKASEAIVLPAWYLGQAYPRLRLLAMLVIAAAVFAVTPSDWRTVTRFLTGWTVGVSAYVATTLFIMFVSSIEHIRKRAAEEDEGRAALLMLTITAATVSVIAAILQAGKTETGAEPGIGNLLLATATILLSWSLIHIIFALHYAHEFYASGGGSEGGLDFPGEAENDADYWDFLYFSFTIGMTFQTSDVAIASREIRRTATAHSIVSFIFNTVIVAVTVNIAASAI